MRGKKKETIGDVDARVELRPGLQANGAWNLVAEVWRGRARAVRDDQRGEDQEGASVPGHAEASSKNEARKRVQASVMAIL